MRAPLALAAALLVLPVLPTTAAPMQLPGEAGEAVPLSHGFFTPYMHLAALDIPKGIRPGAWLMLGTSNCTASFVLKDAAGALYITTAAHCVSVGQRAAIKQDTLVAGLGSIEEFGTVVAALPVQELDAALIRVDPAKHSQVNPRMTGWGGPTGLLTAIPEANTVTLHSGWGWVTWYEQQTRCRRGIASVEDFTSRVWWTNEVGGGGDSGSAIMTADGKALGILDWGGGVVVPTLVTGAFVSSMVGGVRLDAVLAAWNAQGWGLSLVEGGPVSPVCDPTT